METIKDAQLVDVLDKDGRITMSFLENDRIYEVKWNKRAYDQSLNDWVESEEKEQQVEDWSQQYFGCPSKQLPKQIGTKKDVYYYDTYCSLWESDTKFTKADEGCSFQTTIDSIDVTDSEIAIYYYWEDRKYKSKMSFTQKVGDQYFLNPMKKRKQYEKFEKKFKTPVEEAQKLIGDPILVKVKSAFKKFFYGEIDYLG